MIKELYVKLRFLTVIIALSTNSLAETREESKPKLLDDYESITCTTTEDCRALAKYHGVNIKVLCDYHRCAIILEDENNLKRVE